jgi:16S rRNA processing protein RimM
MKTVQIGYTKKPHALKGEIKLQIKERYLEDLMDTDVVLIDVKGRQMPFFIEDIRVGNTIIAKFEGVDTPEAASGIASKALYLREEDIFESDEEDDDGNGLQYSKYVGYMILDGTTKVGVIESVEEYPQQEMAIVTYKKKSVLIPLNAQFILQIEDAKKQILMELPDGLLDL